MSGKEGGAAEETERVRLGKIYAIAEAAPKIIYEVGRWGTVLFLIYTTGDVLKAYAGKITLADVTFSWLVSDKLAGVLGLIFGTGGILYGRRQARLRKDVVERMHHFQMKYEKTFDPKRSSSSLTVRGDTREEDL